MMDRRFPWDPLVGFLVDARRVVSVPEFTRAQAIALIDAVVEAERSPDAACFVVDSFCGLGAHLPLPPPPASVVKGASRSRVWILGHGLIGRLAAGAPCP